MAPADLTAQPGHVRSVITGDLGTEGSLPGRLASITPPRLTEQLISGLSHRSPRARLPTKLPVRRNQMFPPRRARLATENKGQHVADKVRGHDSMPKYRHGVIKGLPK